MKKRKCRLGMNMVLAVIVLACIVCFRVLTMEGEARYSPEYPMEDITSYLEKELLTEEEYQLLYQQTGLSPDAIDTLKEAGRSEVIMAVQERFFAETEIICERDFLLFNETLEKVPDITASTSGGQLRSTGTVMPVLEDGDILITFNCHFLGWRNGHAAIVLDAERGLVLEALSLGQDSAVLSVRKWSEYPSFAVLRLSDVPGDVRAEVADYAESVLTGLPYQLSAGLWSENVDMVFRVLQLLEDGDPLDMEGPLGTNCSHLIWYAYKQFGYDLDSDGGLIVTPKDLYDSPLLEVVQIYGMKP